MNSLFLGIWRWEGGGSKNPGPILNNTLFAPFCKPFLPAVGGGAPIKEGYRKHFFVSFPLFFKENGKKNAKNITF